MGKGNAGHTWVMQHPRLGGERSTLSLLLTKALRNYLAWARTRLLYLLLHPQHVPHAIRYLMLRWFIPCTVTPERKAKRETLDAASSQSPSLVTYKTQCLNEHIQ